MLHFGEELNFHTRASQNIKYILKMWISSHPLQTHDWAEIWAPLLQFAACFLGLEEWTAATEIFLYAFQAEVTSFSMLAIQEECSSKCNEDFLLLSACKAPAIILILRSPKGSYYCIYINSPGLLHLVHTGQGKKAWVIREMPEESGWAQWWHRDCIDLCAALWLASLSCWWQ